MSKKPKKIKEEFKLEVDYPSEITETGIYRVNRTINGVKDTINLMIWSQADIDAMEKYAEEYYAEKENAETVKNIRPAAG